MIDHLTAEAQLAYTPALVIIPYHYLRSTFWLLLRLSHDIITSILPSLARYALTTCSCKARPYLVGRKSGSGPAPYQSKQVASEQQLHHSHTSSIEVSPALQTPGELSL